jgi:spermidine/putrescine transport system ATP-binding protein
VSVRPEKVHVSKKLVECENVFEARVTEELFQGAMDRLDVELTGGTVLTAVVANESALLEAIHEGDRVWCGLHADDLVVVRME